MRLRPLKTNKNGKMKFKLEVRQIWEFGQRKDANGEPHQEDSIFPEYGKATAADRLFVLCDGMGGHDAGEVASSLVCQTMNEHIKAVPEGQEDHFDDATFQQALSACFDVLDKNDTGAEKKMGTTLTLLKFSDEGATIAHMGDSRVYHIRPGKRADDTKILFVTRDHSLVNDLIAAGELSPAQAKNYPRRNVITRALQPGLKNRPKADICHTNDIQAGDYFYLCSDGMLEQMEDRNIRFNFSEMTGDIDNKVKVLTSATTTNRDNHSAILVRVTEVEGAPAVPTTTSTASPLPLMAEVEETAPANIPQMPTQPEHTQPVMMSPEQQRGFNRGVSNPAEEESNSNNKLIILLSAIAAIAVAIVILFVAGVFDSKESKPKQQVDAENVQTTKPEIENKSARPTEETTQIIVNREEQEPQATKRNRETSKQRPTTQQPSTAAPKKNNSSTKQEAINKVKNNTSNSQTSSGTTPQPPTNTSKPKPKDPNPASADQ